MKFKNAIKDKNIIIIFPEKEKPIHIDLRRRIIDKIPFKLVRKKNGKCELLSKDLNVIFTFNIDTNDYFFEGE